MMKYKCPSCGKVFNPEKDEICPKCGEAAAPSVMTRLERRRAAQWLRAEGNHHYDEHCHDDDAWKQSYGADTHRAAVRSHEAELRAGYAAHKPVDNPTRLSNANPASPSNPNPTRLSNANPASSSNANSAPKPAGKSTYRRPQPLRWIVILWVLYVLYRLFQGVIQMD